MLMSYEYPINLEGHDEWLESGYKLALANGRVVTRDGEIIGTWQVVDFDPDDEESGGRYNFICEGQSGITISEGFLFLDSRTSRGLALSNFSRSIREWHER